LIYYMHSEIDLRMAIAAKPEVEIWRKHVESTFRPRFPIGPPINYRVYLQPFRSSKGGSLPLRQLKQVGSRTIAAKPEVEIWRKHVQSISRPRFPMRP